MRIYDNQMRILKTVLTIISIVLLFSNWVVTCGDFEYNWTEYRDEITNTVYMIERLAYWSGNEIDTSGVEKAIDCILDGKLSAVEMSTIAFEVDALLRNVEVSDADATEMQASRVYLWCYLLVFWSVIVTACIMLVHIWKKGYATLEKGFLIAQIALFVVIGSLCLAAYDLDQQFVIRPTLSALLAVVCAVPTSCIEKLPIYNSSFWNNEIFLQMVNKSRNIVTVHREKIQNVAVEKWECNACGKKNHLDAKFCSSCGKKKPEKIKCKNCGFEIQDDDLFCKNCGTKMVEKRCICSNCGCSIDTGSEFCEFCGEKVK